MPTPTSYSTPTSVDFGAFPTIANDFPSSVSAIPTAAANDNAHEAQLYALLQQYNWGAGASVTYSFPTSAATNLWDQAWYAGYETSYFTPLATAFPGAVAAVNTALANWSHVANITFTLVTESPSNVGDIRIGVTDMNAFDLDLDGTYAYAWSLGNSAAAGDVWINAEQPVASGTDFSLGANGYSTVLHELGHAIGLDHPFSIYAFDEYSPGQYGALDNYDTFQYTTMSYSDQPHLSDQGDSSYYPTTPMWLDIQAMQYAYGANTTYNLGNTTYTFLQGQNYYETIYDAGGNDTIVYSATSDGAVIDLRGDFNFSSLGNAISLSNGGVQNNNVTIYVNGNSSLVIENATGGAGTDSIIGNDVGNVVNGLGGADTILGGLGNDTLSGNVGLDSLEGGAGDDSMLGNRGFDTMSGDAGNDWMQSNRGSDWIFGGDGNDTVDGGAGFDTLLGGIGADLVIGSPGNDSIEGNSGADTIVGGNGSDTMNGGTETDVYRYDALSLNTDDVAANTADSIVGGQGDLISMAGLLNDLELGNTLLGDRPTDWNLATPLSVGVNDITFSGGFLQFDLDHNGSIDGSDFQISLPGVTFVTYFSGDDLFHLT
jgi:serralysin